MTKLRGRQRDVAAVALIFLCCLVVLWPDTIGGRLLLPADMLMVMQPWKEHARELGFERVQVPFLDSIQQHYPWRKFASAQMRQGLIPLWNPYMFCGTPFIANNQSACFYPETWLFMLMPPERAFGWAALLSLTMGGSFMFFFLRVLGLRRAAAFAGTIPFIFCGFIVGWLLLPTVRAVPMWLPLMLLAFELSLRRRSLPWAGLCAVAVGMQFLAGHLQISLFVLIIFTVYAVFRIVQEWRQAGRAAGLMSLVYAAVPLGLGTMLAALQLLPVLELVGMNPRAAGHGFASVAGNAMVPVYLLAGLMPDLFGNPANYNFWGSMLFTTHREYIETAWYIGVAPLLLIVAALAWRRQRSPQTWLWSGLWLAGAGLAWGTVLYWLLYELLPPLRQLPGISRMVMICCFSGAVLSAFGLEAVCRQVEAGEGPEVRRVVGYAALAFGLVAVVGGLGVWMYTGRLEQVLPGIGNFTLLQIARCVGLIIAAVLAITLITRRPRYGLPLLLAVMAVDIFYFAAKFTPEVPDKYLHVKTEDLSLMHRDHSLYRMTSLLGNGPGIDRMPPNLPMAFGFQDVQGSDSLVYDGYVSLMSKVPKDAKGNPDPASPLLALLNCKYLLTSLNLTRVPGYRLLTTYETNLYQNLRVLPRAFLAPQVQRLPLAAALEKLGDGFDPHRLALLSDHGATPVLSGPLQPLRITEYTPDSVTISGPLPAGRLAVLGDIWYPGWRVYLDGVRQPVLPVDYALRGVLPSVPAKQARFIYYPGSFAVGGFASCLAVLLIACLIVAGWRRRR